MNTPQYLLSGLEKPSAGTVNAPSRTERGFIFQDYNLLEAMTAADNALVSARLLGRRVPRRWVRELFDDLGLHGLERRLPHQLSGGQQQRVAIARVLLADVPYIFADEPTGALDPESSEVVLTHLRQAADAGAVVVLVTHQDETVLHRAGASGWQRRMVGWWESAAVVATAGILTLVFTVYGLALTNHVYFGAAWPTGWWREVLWGPLAVILAAMWLLVAGVLGVTRPVIDHTSRDSPVVRTAGQKPETPSGETLRV